MEKYSRFGVHLRLPEAIGAPTRDSLGRIAKRLDRYGLEVDY
jgi:hypothetical protein